MSDRVTVVVGAGSGGGSLAARLAERTDEEVILIEAGPDYVDPGSIPGDLLDPSQMSLTDHDWGLRAYFVEPPEDRAPQPYAKGKVVGGSSAVNLAIAERASVDDFEAWVHAGNDEWTYAAALPYFQRLETDLDYGERPGHGVNGPVTIRRFRPDELTAVGRAVREASLSRGFPECADFNAAGSTGIGLVPRNLVDEFRASTLLTYLQEARDRANLTILGDTLCRRVLFDGRRAIGVEVEHANGEIREIEAARVVLAAGAAHTPQILMLSGIGARATLERFGIPEVIANDAVGRNLSDHTNVPTVALLKDGAASVGVRNHLKFTSPGSDLINDLLMAVSVFDPADRLPDVDVRGRHALSLVTLLSRPRSRGWVTLTSPDIHDQPEIHLNYLGDRSDVERLKHGIRLAYDIATSMPVAGEIDEILFPAADIVADDARLEQYMRHAAATVQHIASTCRMGPANDPEAVVDQRLAVRGTAGLWIADASVLPSVPTALTNLTVYMVGERLADWLTADQPVAC